MREDTSGAGRLPEDLLHSTRLQMKNDALPSAAVEDSEQGAVSK